MNIAVLTLIVHFRVTIVAHLYPSLLKDSFNTKQRWMQCMENFRRRVTNDLENQLITKYNKSFYDSTIVII